MLQLRASHVLAFSFTFLWFWRIKEKKIAFLVSCLLIINLLARIQDVFFAILFFLGLFLFEVERF